jgi:hypothetical protein
MSDLCKSPLIKGASSPKPSHKSLQHVFSPLLMSPQQGFQSPVLSAQQNSMHLSPPPRGASQLPAIRDRVARPPMIKSSSTMHIQSNSPQPPLQSSMSHTGVITRQLGQDRPDIASVALETEARNSLVMEPPPIYVHSPFLSRHSTTTSATSSIIQDRRAVSHFSIDSDDTSSKAIPPVKILKDAFTQTEIDLMLRDESENKGRRKEEFGINQFAGSQTPKVTAAVRDQSSSNSLQSSRSKKRVKKKRSMPMLSPSPISNFDSHNDYIEIMDLEEM